MEHYDGSVGAMTRDEIIRMGYKPVRQCHPRPER